jgi:hypothetical protein
VPTLWHGVARTANCDRASGSGAVTVP